MGCRNIKLHHNTTNQSTGPQCVNPIALRIAKVSGVIAMLNVVIVWKVTAYLHLLLYVQAALGSYVRKLWSASGS